MAYLSMGAVWADAIFVSGLQRRDELSADQVRQAVGAAIWAFGCSGCAERVAQEFGDHPDTAAIRMRWAHGVAREAFADPPPGSGPGADAVGLLAIHPAVVCWAGVRLTQRRAACASPVCGEGDG